MRRGFALLLGLGLFSCTGCTGMPVSGTDEITGKQCHETAECGPNPAATCVRTCSDNSNPCVFVCRDLHCVTLGCPGDIDAGPPDAAVANAHAEGESCDDALGCVTGLVCTGVGDPCPTFPNCKVCYLPCGPGGVCPSDYRTCIPPSGQGGNVCIH
jgi:hypothetical protein